jgi:uncharacterized protein YcsI (UPF0317 family)
VNGDEHKCCAAWEKLSPQARMTREWAFLHQLAHSRVAFRDDYFAQLVGISLDRAKAMTYEAKQMAWIKAGETVPGFDQANGTLWVGRLAATRK